MDLAFDFERRLDVDIARMCLEVGKFFGRNQTVAALRFGKRDPHLAPELAALLFREQHAQFGPTVSPGERRSVGVVVHGITALSRSGSGALASRQCSRTG